MKVLAARKDGKLSQIKKTMDIPRRNRIDLNTPAELAIRKACEEVEKIGADIRLTDAVNLLHQAREKVADFLDGK